MDIKPNSFIREFKSNLEEIFLKKNDPITNFKDNEVFIFSVPLDKIKLYGDILIQNFQKYTNINAFEMFLQSLNEPQI